ncbi:unnamed protein product [Owenia fusiformis]|uniref:Uncharacterized protein n=1 Tax=Owenia fusiformis TaxID=6347 RepID=A0A8J1US78_OWEFU|nr:unnamed protein product [Owenia fusiformis]
MENNGYVSDEKGVSDSKIVIDDAPSPEKINDQEKYELAKAELASRPYAGMPKDDLLRFSQTPFWKRFRIACLVIFWLIWLGLLAAVVALTIVWPRCNSAPSQDWWQTSAMYQVYPKSFQDSNGDEYGDLKGVESRLKYLKELKTEAVILSSVYKTNGVDHGYDVTNHTLIDPIFGTMNDFDALLKKTHEESMYLVVDFIPNHSSDQHPWFIESKKATSNSYRNYYVWADCTPTDMPNNWRSVYGGSAWTYDSDRQQCYLHQFLTQQPELNLRSAQVREELEAIMRFWLDKGVDGFRVNSVDYLFEDYDLRDEPSSSTSNVTNAYDSLDHIYTKSQPEIHDIIARWRAIIDEYSKLRNGRKRVLLTDADVEVSESMNYYKYLGRQGAHLPQNFLLSKVSPGCGGYCVEKQVMDWTRGMPSGSTATWLLGSQNQGRIANQLVDYTRVASMLQLLLPGTPMVYYGEDIGMHNANLTTSKDPGYTDPKQSRDRARTPMQWMNGTNAGFSNGTVAPWLPVNPSSVYRNVMVENEDGNSMLGLYKALLTLRRENSFKYGTAAHVAVVNDDVFSFVREFDGQERYLVAVNFGNKDSTVNYYTDHHLVPEQGEVVETTRNNVGLSGTRSLNGVKLSPGQGVVFKWDAPPR